MLPATTSFHFALVFSLIVCPASAFGQDSFSDVFINLNAESFVRFSGTGLGTGAAEEISTTYPPDLMDPFFDELIAGTADSIQPNGAMNHGMWQVSQQTTLSATGLSTSMMQSAVTTTDGGSPGITLQSRLDLTFQVTVPITIRLDGITMGNATVGSDDFARVLLKEGNLNRFHSGNEPFPFDYTLQPDNDYSLQAFLKGHTDFNDMTESSIDLTMSVLPSRIVETFYLDTYSSIVYTDAVGQDLGVVLLKDGSDYITLENYAVAAADHAVRPDIHPGPDGFALVSMNTDEQSLTASFFSPEAIGTPSCLDGPELQSLRTLQTIPPSAIGTIYLHEATLVDVDAVISPRDPASGLPTGIRFGAALVENAGEAAIVDWQWGPDCTASMNENPRVTVLRNQEPNQSTKLDFMDGPEGTTMGALASSSALTLFDFGDLSLPGPLNPIVLATIESPSSSFNPNMMRVQMGPEDRPLVAIQEGNTLHLYQYNGTTLEPDLQQTVSTRAIGFDVWVEDQDLYFYVYELDNQLFRGRHGQPPYQKMQFGDVTIELNDSTPTDSPTSYISWDGNANVAIDSSYVPPPEADSIEVVAAKDAVMIVTDNKHPDGHYRAIGNRAAVLATGQITGTVVSHGQEAARTFSMADPQTENPSLLNDTFADAVIETVNPAARARLRESLGTESAGSMIDALVVSDTPQAGTRQAIVEVLEYQEGGDITRTHEFSSEVDYEDGIILRAGTRNDPIPVFCFTHCETVTTAVTPDSYLIASNNPETPVAEQLAEAVSKPILEWINMSLQADPENPTVRAEINFSYTDNRTNGELAFFWGEAAGTDNGEVSVELGYVAAKDPGTEVIETSFFGSPTEVADQLASQLYSLPEREDEVLVVFLRAELRALDGIARFTNTAGLFQMLPGLLVDFSGDGTVDIDDVDLLVSEIANFTGNLDFDLTADGLVNQDDLDRWLSDAAAASGFAEPYLKGDSNLDGTVNAVDLNNLALNWQESPGTWSGGDFSANGTVDTGDLNQLALNWNNSIAMAATAVPEPATVYLAICFLGLMILDRR